MGASIDDVVDLGSASSSKGWLRAQVGVPYREAVAGAVHFVGQAGQSRRAPDPLRVVDRVVMAWVRIAPSS